MFNNTFTKNIISVLLYIYKICDVGSECLKLEEVFKNDVELLQLIYAKIYERL